VDKWNIKYCQSSAVGIFYLDHLNHYLAAWQYAFSIFSYLNAWPVTKRPEKKVFQKCRL